MVWLTKLEKISLETRITSVWFPQRKSECVNRSIQQGDLKLEKHERRKEWHKSEKAFKMLPGEEKVSMPFEGQGSHLGRGEPY